MNRICSITKLVITDRGLCYCPIGEGANARIRPDVVIVEDRQERHTEGSYYLTLYNGTMQVRLSVGKSRRMRTRNGSARKRS